MLTAVLVAVYGARDGKPYFATVKYENIRPIYTTETFWHGSDKNGTCTKKYSMDTSFTHPFFCHANHCEITFLYGCRAQVFGKSWFGSANHLHYKFIRAGLVFLVHVPTLPVLGLPFQ